MWNVEGEIAAAGSAGLAMTPGRGTQEHIQGINSRFRKLGVVRLRAVREPPLRSGIL